MKKTYKAFSAGELSEDMYGRYDVDKYGTGCMILKNWVILAQGGVYKRPGMKFVASISDETRKARALPFKFSTVQPYVLEFGHETMRVYKDGELVLESNQNITGATQANPAQITIVGHGYSTGEEVFIQSVGGMTELNGRQFKITVVDVDNFTLDGVDSTSYTAYTSGGTAARVFEIATPYQEAELFEIDYAQTADVMTLVHRNHAPRELTRTDHDAWTLTTPTFAPSLTTPTGVSATATTGSGGTTYKYKVTAFEDEFAEESLPSSEATCTNDLSTSGNENTISWSSVSGADTYNIYKDKNGVFGYIGTSEGTSFVDDNIAPDVSDTPPRANNPFDASNKYPGAVAYAKQRRVFASTNEKPDTIWMSRAGQYYNFTKSIPNKDEDSIQFAPASGEVNAIEHLLAFRDLIAMTDAQEFQIYGDNGAYTPTTMNADPQTNYGTSKVKPIKIGNTAIFAARFGRRVRDFKYAFESDGYNGNDISVLSKHLLRGREIVDWAFAQEPDDVVWAVTDQGDLYSLTYLQEHRVWGWARHETEGVVESVAVIPDAISKRDVPHFIVQRNVDGVTHRYMETLQPYIDDPMVDAFFVDSGLSYSGSAITEVSGLWHLEGESVTIYADGNVLPTQIVSMGKVTLTTAASDIHIGLSYDYEIQPLATETDQGKFGASKGDPKAIKTIDIEVVRTRGLFAAQKPEDRINDMDNEIRPKFEDGDISNPIEGYSGILEIAVDAQWDGNYVAPYIYDSYPTPAKILTMTPNYEVN